MFAEMVPILQGRLRKVGSMTLYELFRCVWGRGRRILKERFQKAAERDKTGSIFNYFRKLVICELVKKELIIEKILEYSRLDAETARLQLLCVGDGLVVKNSSSEHCASPVVASFPGECSCTHNDVFFFSAGDLLSDWKQWSVSVPCASVNCLYPHLLAYQLPPARDGGIGSMHHQAAAVNTTREFQASRLLDDVGKVNKLDREEASCVRNLATYSDITVADLASLKEAWAI